VIRHISLAAFVLSFFSAAAAPALAVPHEGDPAPAFTLARASGGSISLANYKGKPLYLNFFASWCGPCNDEAPSVGKLYAKYHSKGFTVLGINELEDKTKALAFARQYKWPFAIAVDDGTMGGSYGIVGLPVHIFIDKSGKVSTYRLGQMDPPEIEAAIKRIL
jgi:cytochrome c biogenesis protein CcmG/thiol:disulfide interchange protein DsbE